MEPSLSSRRSAEVRANTDTHSRFRAAGPQLVASSTRSFGERCTPCALYACCTAHNPARTGKASSVCAESSCHLAQNIAFATCANLSPWCWASATRSMRTTREQRPFGCREHPLLQGVADGGPAGPPCDHHLLFTAPVLHDGYRRCASRGHPAITAFFDFLGSSLSDLTASVL